MNCLFHGDQCWLRANARTDDELERLRRLQVRPEVKPEPEKPTIIRPEHIKPPPAKPGMPTTFEEAFKQWYQFYKWHFGMLMDDTIEHINHAYEEALKIQGEKERCTKFCETLNEKRLEIAERNKDLSQRIRAGELDIDDPQVKVHNAEESAFITLFNVFGCRKWLGLMRKEDTFIIGDIDAKIPIPIHGQLMQRIITFCENLTEDDDLRCQCLDIWDEFLWQRQTEEWVREQLVKIHGEQAYERARKKVLEIHGEVPQFRIPECD